MTESPVPTFTAEEARRGRRLVDVMDTTTARWCADVVRVNLEAHHQVAGAAVVTPTTMARDLAGDFALGIVRAVYGRGLRATNPWVRFEAVRVLALDAYSSLLLPLEMWGEGFAVHEAYEGTMARLTDAHEQLAAAVAATEEVPR